MRFTRNCSNITATASPSTRPRKRPRADSHSVSPLTAKSKAAAHGSAGQSTIGSMRMTRGVPSLVGSIAASCASGSVAAPDRRRPDFPKPHHAQPAPRPHRQAQNRDHNKIDRQVREDHLRSRQRLGEQQLHGAAIDLAGDGPGGPADRPHAQDRLRQRMHVTDREHIQALSTWTRSPPMSACMIWPGPVKKRSRRRLKSASVMEPIERGQQLLRDPLRDLRPQAFEGDQQQRHDQERKAQVAEQFSNEHVSHASAP